jgi:hypothetical protein
LINAAINRRRAGAEIGEKSLHPAVLVPRHVGDVFLAGPVVNQADDECPHDLAPLFEQGG